MQRHTARLWAPGDISLALQQARFARGLTQAELARELDVSQSAISELESGKSTIQMRRILEFAQLVGLELSASWDGPEVPPIDLSTAYGTGKTTKAPASTQGSISGSEP